MKRNIKYVISMVFMLLMTQGAWADPVTIIKQLNGVVATTTSPGVVDDPVIANGKCTLTVTPAEGNYVTKDFITAYAVVTGDLAQAPRRAPNLYAPITVTAKDATADPTGVTQYEFTMPTDENINVEVTVNFQSITTYNIYIGDTQVTSVNASNILAGDQVNDGKVTFTPAQAATQTTPAVPATLTLNGATLTAPLIVGLDNLTIDIQGNNSITTDVTCIQRKNDTSPYVAFKSTSQVVGNLMLSKTGNDGGICDLSYQRITVSKDLAPIIPDSKSHGGYTSNIYEFTDGNLREAMFVPSYGVQVGDLLVYEGNASDVFGDGKVSFTPASGNTPATLTLNNTIVESIGTSLSELDIDLIGNNSIRTSDNGAVFKNPYGLESVIINVKSTAIEKGCLALYLFNNASGFLDTNVHLNNTSPLSIFGDLDATYQANVMIGEPVADGYDLYVNNIKLVTGNMSNITNVSLNGRPKASFDALTYTLTLEGVGYSYLMNNTNNILVQSNLENLKVKFVGDNSVTLGNNKYAFKYTGTVSQTTPTLTFDNSESNGHNTYGKLTVNGISSVANIADGYTISNSSTWLGDGSMTEGWKYSQSDTKVEVWYQNEVYMTVAGVQVTSANASNILAGNQVNDGKVLFTPAQEATESTPAVPATLTLNGASIDLTDDEFHGVEYFGADNLTVKLIGNNSIKTKNGYNPFLYNGGNATRPTLTYESGSSSCSLALDGGNSTVIKSFGNVNGVNGVNSTTGNLLMLTNADNDELHYYYDNGDNGKYGLYTTEEATTIANSVTIKSGYGITVAGVLVHEGNKDNVLGNQGTPTVVFTPADANNIVSTLTLNNADIDRNTNESGYVSIVTSLDQLNINLIGESSTYAIKATSETCGLTFKSAEDNRGAARLNFWYSADPQFTGFGEGKVTYSDGLCLRRDYTNQSFPKVVALYVPKVVTDEPEYGLYYPDHLFTFSLAEDIEGFDIYYANLLGVDAPVKTTNGTFTLGAGSYTLRCYPIYPGMTTEPGSNYQFAAEIYPKVIEKPTFSVASGTYNEPKTIFLNNVPEQETNIGYDSEQNEIRVPQIWYYIGDNKNDSVRYDATKGIEVTESCKVSVYILDEDSGKVVKSDAVSETYTIKPNIANLYVAPIEDIPYTGSAVTPTIVVKETEDATTSLTPGTDYTVSYKQGNATVDASELIYVGEYTAVITGTGSYGGSKEVIFNISKATPTITFAQESYSVVFGETFTSPEVEGDWDVTPTASSNMEVAIIEDGAVVIVGVGTTTITVTYAGDDNHFSTSASYQLIVSRGMDIAFAGTNLWASYYATENLTVPEGLTAYVVSNLTETNATVTEVAYIPKNNAVLLKRADTDAAASGYTAEAYTGTTTQVTNFLAGSVNGTDISSIQNQHVYVLFNDKFKRAISGTIPARRAYLLLGGTMAPTGAPQYLTISIIDGTTGVSDVRSKMAEVGDDYYDLSGRKLQQKPAKSGLYIQNGKKVYINNK